MKTTHTLRLIIGLFIGLPLAGWSQNPIDIASSITNVPCAGGYTGAINLTLTGGTPPYNYDWSNTAGNNNPEDLTQIYAGNYCVTVTDAQGKTATKCFEVTDPDCPVIIKRMMPLVSVGGQPVTIAPQVLGGTPLYHYSWSNFNFSSQVTVSPSFNSNYTVTVTDANGCTNSSTFPVEVAGFMPALAFYFYNSGCGLSGYHSAIVFVYNMPPGNLSYTLTPSSPFQSPDAGTFTGNSFVLNNICTQGCKYTLKVTGPGGATVSEMFGDPTSYLGLYITSPLYITSNNPSLCPPAATTQCERVCPNSTVTYHAGPYSALCDGTELNNFDWEIVGATSYFLNADKTEATITWGNSGSGIINVTKQTDGCYSGSYCVEIVNLPEANMHAIPSPVAPDSTLTVCKGQEVHFESQSLHADLFEWTFGDDDSNASADHTAHIFDHPGVYPVTLIARSLCYCADTTHLNVAVLDVPAPTLNCVSAVCPGESITYSTTSDCGEYHWEVSPNGIVTAGGGIADDSISVQWLDGANGSIGLELASCTGASCPVKATIPVPVISNLAKIKGAAFVCHNTEEVYAIDNFDGTSYTWKIIPQNYYSPTIIDGQGTSTVRIRISQYTGNYSIVVNYDNCYLGCSGTDTLPFKIRTPVAIVGPAKVCEGQPKNFIVKNPTNTIKSDWTVYGPNGMVAETFANTNTITPLLNQGPGEYLIVAIPTAAEQNFTCTERMEWTVTISPSPPKPVSIDGPGCFCPGAVQVYTANAGNNPVIWTTSLNASVETNNPYNLAIPVSASTPIWISASAISADGSGCTSDTIRKWIDPLETPKLMGGATVCAGTVGVYSASPGIDGLNYTWEVIPAGAGVVVNGQSSATAEVFWIMPGSHTLKVSICNKSASRTITVNNAPMPVPLYPQGVCKGQLATVTAPGAWSAYSWETSDHHVVSADPTISVGPGTYLLHVTDGNGCTAASAFDIIEYPQPNLTISTTDPTGFCNNAFTVTMYALTDDDGHYTYEWFRDGVALGDNHNTHSSFKYGDYTAQVTNEYGCTATDGLIHVFEFCGGGVVFGDTPPNYCQPGDLGLDVLPTPACDSFQFNVVAGANYVPGSAFWILGQSGDSVIGTLSGDNVAYTFPNGGKYLVIVTATLQNGATCALIDSVDVDVVAHFTVAQACPGDSTWFNDESTRLPDKTIDTWDWSFGDPSGTHIATHSSGPVAFPYGATNNYTATLTITSGSGCTASYSQPVVIPPLPNLVLPPITNGCVDHVATLSAQTSPEVINVAWNFGQPGSGSNTANGNVVYHYFGNTPGAFPVIASAQNIWGCTESVAQLAVVSNNNLSGAITPAGESNLCSGQTVALSAPAIGGSYLWSNGDTTQTINVGAEGVYLVTITGTNGCQFIPAPKIVNISPTPGGYIQAQMVNTLGQNIGVTNTVLDMCYGEDVTLTLVSSGNYQYQWSGSLGTEQIVIFSEDRHNLLGIGTYTYQVTITDVAGGCYTVTPPFTVNVHPVPSDISAVTSQPCAGNLAEISYAGPNDPDWLLTWNNGMTGPSFITTAPGRYIVTATNQYGCSKSSDPVVLSPGPNVAAIPNGCHTRCLPDSICLPPFTGIVAWQWYLNGAPIPGATQSVFVAEESGTYYAELTDTLGCTAHSGPLSLQLYPGTGNVYGRVWSDVNNNGIIDAADTLVSGIPVLLFENLTQIANGQSGANGEAAFLNVASSHYLVHINESSLSPFWDVVIASDSVSVAGCGAKGFGDLLIDHCATMPGALVLNACNGASVNYLGTAIATGQSHDFILTGTSGCDSILTVTVHALPVAATTLDAHICPGTTYSYHGVNLAVGQSQAFTLMNYLGCDSIVTVNVTALPATTATLNVKTCPGTTYNYQGVNLAVGQSQAFTLTNASGCDSIVTVNVTALPTSASTLNVKTCPGTTYNYQGVNLAVGQTQAFTLTNALGCDSIVTVNVTALPASASTLIANICPGATYTYQGISLAVGQTQAFTLTNALGCDSIVTVFVSALPTSASTLNVKACPGTTYSYHGANLAVGQTQAFTLTNTLGCDSIVTVSVSALPTSASTLNVKTCPGTTYSYHGSNLAAGQTQAFTLTNTLGCDSIVTVTVGALPTSTGAASFGVCPHETYTYQGQALPPGTVQDFTLTNWLGCDSIVTVTVFEKASSAEIREVSVCPGQAYVYNGETIAIGQTKDIHFSNGEGCDSLITIHVTAWPALDFTVDAQNTCPTAGTGAISITVVPGGSSPTGFALNGIDYQPNTKFDSLAAGNYTVSVQDENGCIWEKPAAVAASPNLELSLSGSYLIPCDSARITLAPVIGGDTSGLHLTWWNGALTPSVTVDDATSVWIDATNHCAETLHREAEVNWADSDGDPLNIYVPNIFAPAAKNAENTMFRAFFGHNLTLLKYRIEVYDRWGNMLFASDRPEVGWTGPFRDKIMDPGVYVWQLWVKLAFCGREIELYKKGDVMVER